MSKTEKLNATLMSAPIPDHAMHRLEMWVDEKAQYGTFMPTDVITIAYLEYAGKDEEGRDSYNVCNSEYYDTSDLVRAVKAFNSRLASNPFKCSEDAGSLEEFAIPSAKKDEFPSHQYINRDQAKTHLVYLARRLVEIDRRGWADDLYAISHLL